MGATDDGAPSVGALLRALVLPSPCPDLPHRDLTRVEAERLLELARAHRVSGRLAAGVAALGLALPEDVARELRADRTATAMAHLTATRGLAGVDDVLGAAQVPYLVVKGPVLSSLWYGDAGARRYGDLDVLVDPDDFSAALDALGAAGFEELASNWAGHTRRGVAETPLQRGPTALDLHWDLVGLGVDRVDVDLRTPELLRRARTVVIGGRAVATLDPEDTLVHLCVHGGLAGGRRLLHLLDVDAVVRAGPDWDVVVARARRAGARALALGLLQRTRRVLGTPVPDEVLARLEPYRGLRAATARVDRLHDNGVTGGGVQLEALRDSPAATARAATRRLRVAARTVLTGEHPAAAGSELAWQADHDDADRVRSDRAGYLSWVTAEAAMVTARPTRDAARLARLFAAHEPRSSTAIGHAVCAPRLGRGVRAWVVRTAGGTPVGALVTVRLGPLWVFAHPLLLQPTAAAPIGALLQRSDVTTVVGFEPDVAPLEPHLDRWRRVVELRSGAVAHADIPELPPTAARIATHADLDGLVDVLAVTSPMLSMFPGQARAWARRAIGRGCSVLTGDRGEVVGFCSLEASSAAYDVVGTMGILPPWRGRGLAWDLVLALADHARARGRGLVGLSLPHNPMRIPAERATSDDALLVHLRDPRRFPGERRLRHALRRGLAWGRRRRSS